MAEFSETTTKTVNCPDCASGHVVKIGKQSGEQRYLCRGCATKFRANGKAKGRRIPAEWIGAAIRQYYSGMSYKQIAEYMEDAYDIPEPSKATIYEWVRDYTQAAMEESEKYPAHTSDNWVVDEMVLDVGGDKYWNWNVMDHDTRYLLASYLSSERDQKSAEAVLRKAMAASANPPKTITTDRLPSYVPAIKEVFPEAEHIQSEGLESELNNNRSERMQGTFRDRTKTLRGLEGRESGQRYLDGWVFHYNHFKEHHGLKGGTPAEAAQVNAPFTEWADITRGPSSPVPVEERQEVEKETNIRRWVRDRWQTLDGHRRGETELRWQSIPIRDVMNNREKVKTRQSRPAPGFRQGSRYYVTNLPGVGLALVRVSSQWGDLASVEGKRNNPGLPARSWELEGGKRKRDGSIPKVSQAGYIPLADDGRLKPVEKTSHPKERNETPANVESQEITVRPRDTEIQLRIDPKTGEVTGPPELTVVSSKTNRGTRHPPLSRRRHKQESSGVVMVNITFGR